VTELPYQVQGGQATCEIIHEGAAEVRLTGRVLPTRPGRLTTNHGMSFMEGSVLDVPVRVNPLAQGTSFLGKGCRLELGDGPIAEVLRALKIGRLVRYDYVPKAQLILPAGRRVA